MSDVPTSAIKKSSEKSASSSKPQLRIFLIGMMGSGKSYWSERLKKKLKVPAYDLDALVEMMEEKSITEMFTQDGEEYFRNQEAKMLRLFSEKKSFILSCGGGTPCFKNNMEWMNRNGITIFLDEPIEVLSQRLSIGQSHRPLIKDLTEAELETFLSKKLVERLPFYSLATLHLQANQITEQQLVKKIKAHA